MSAAGAAPAYMRAAVTGEPPRERVPREPPSERVPRIAKPDGLLLLSLSTHTHSH